MTHAEPISANMQLVEAADSRLRGVLRLFGAVLVVLFVLGGFGYYDVSNARNVWREEALQAQEQIAELTEEYLALYEEFIEVTGVEPDAPSPDAVGTASVPGPTGETGAQGPQGPQGPVGPVGPQGVEGKPGVQGIQGVPGIDGAQGVPGIDGANGANGVDGVQGPIGPVGPVGPAGLNAPLITSATCDGTTVTFGFSDGTFIGTNIACTAVEGTN